VDHAIQNLNFTVNSRSISQILVVGQGTSRLKHTTHLLRIQGWCCTPSIQTP